MGLDDDNHRDRLSGRRRLQTDRLCPDGEAGQDQVMASNVKEPDAGRTVSSGEARAFVARAARFAEMSEDHVVPFVDGLVESDLRGITSHGITRIPPYVRALAEGVVNPRPEVKVLREFGATAVLDGDNGHGVVIGQLAMDRAVEIALELGVGVVAVRNSNHTGMLAVHVLRAASRDMIGYFTSNGPAIMAPFGGREARMGNSPFAYAIPTYSGEPIVLDLACSVVARGKIRMYADHGEPIPDGWALDAQGFPTRDAEAAMDGAVLPMAGYKGYGIAFVTEVLGAVLPGARLSIEMPQAFLQAGSTTLDSWGAGHLAVALNIESFGDTADFKREVDRLANAMKETPLADGVESILVPGEPEATTRAERLEHGIPLTPTLATRLDAFAEEIGIEPI